jgi:hypothetical protein
VERDELRDENDGEELEAEIIRADSAFAADRRGMTAAEDHETLGLDEALARERRDGAVVDEVVAVEDEGAPDVDAELVGGGVAGTGRLASPEEAALSIRDEAPGATDHDDLHMVSW